MKRALITGASGYIGSNLVRYLVTCGWDVHVITRPGSDLKALEEIINNITVHQYAESSHGLVEIVKKAQPDTVFHLASMFLAQHKTDDIEALIYSNLVFATQLLEAMMVNRVSYLINTGTSWQHYNNEVYNPVNLYAATKQAFESILKYYTEVGGIRAVTLKLFDTYGPNDSRAKLISLLWKTAITQQPLEMSPGEQMIDIVHVDDVVRAYEIAANNLPHQNVSHVSYGVSSGEPLKLKDLAEIFEKATGYSLPLSFGARPYRPREVMVPWEKYDTVPGWKPLVNFEMGISHTRHIARNDK